MLEEIIKKKLKDSGNNFTTTGKNFIVCSCLNPNHNDKHPSFSVNTENGYGVCFSCGYKINKKYWLYDVEDEEQVDEIMRASMYKRVEEIYNAEPEATYETLFPPESDINIEDPWRGLYNETMKKYKLYYCDRGHFEDRVIFPMWDYSGKKVAFNSRALGDIKEGMQKYKYSKGINVRELIYPPVKIGTKYIVLCEGIMDALSMVQDGIPAIFNFGVNYTFNNKKIGHLLKMGVETIYLAFDNDKAGVQAITTYMQSPLSDFFELKHGRMCRELIPFYMSECKDYNDFINRRREDEDN